MESELASLQRRLGELEATLAIVSKQTDRPNSRRGPTLAQQVCAGIFILCVGVLLGGSTGSSAAPPIVPIKVAQPFEVVDSTGRVLFRVALGSGGGVVEVLDNNGNSHVTLLGTDTGEFGNIRVQGNIRIMGEDGKFRVAIGRTTAGDGAMVIKSGQTQSAIVLDGRGLLDMHNAQSRKVVSLGVSSTGAGDFHIYNSNGINVAGISAEQGPGVLQLHNTAGQERVTLGTLSNGKGDVCASGERSQNCLSRLDPRY